MFDIDVRPAPTSAFREMYNSLLQDLVCYAYAPIAWEKDNRWKHHIEAMRLSIQALFAYSPSLRELATTSLEETYENAVKKVVTITGTPESAFPTTCPWTLSQVMDKTYLPEPAVKTLPDVE